MKGLYYNGRTADYFEDLHFPMPLEDESLIKITMSAICNTDREIMRGYKPDFTGIMGHEFVGVVQQSNDPEMVGKRVVAELNQGCGHCVYCKTGREKHCESRKCIGIARKDGCFAEYMTTATRLLHPIPDSLPDEIAIFTEPLAAALQIAEMVHIPPSAEICVIGDGRLAFMIAQVLALSGAAVTVLGRHEEKLSMFESFATTSTGLNRRFEIVVDACGSPSGFQTALGLVRSGGTIVLKSTYAGTENLNLSALVVSEITLVGSRCGPFEPALRFLERELLKLPKIQTFQLHQWEAAFESKEFKAGFITKV